jgi:hypothetical protein
MDGGSPAIIAIRVQVKPSPLNVSEDGQSDTATVDRIDTLRGRTASSRISMNVKGCREDDGREMFVAR